MEDAFGPDDSYSHLRQFLSHNRHVVVISENEIFFRMNQRLLRFTLSIAFFWDRRVAGEATIGATVAGDGRLDGKCLRRICTFRASVARSF